MKKIIIGSLLSFCICNVFAEQPVVSSAVVTAKSAIKDASNTLSTQLNPKAIRKVVSSFSTAVASHKGDFARVSPATVKMFSECLSQYVAKDGTYNTNITVEQFGRCCITSSMLVPEACVQMIKDVVDEHNNLAWDSIVKKVPEACMPNDLKNVGYTNANIATSGVYVYVNGVKRCAATACKTGFYLDRYTEGKRYGQSKGICVKGENPWVLVSPSGEWVLKTSIKKAENPELQEGSNGEIVQIDPVGTEFLPEALLEFDFYKQYCEGSGVLRCLKSPTGDISVASVSCTRKAGVDGMDFSSDAIAVCNGTFVAKQNGQSVVKQENTLETLKTETQLLNIEKVPEVQIAVDIDAASASTNDANKSQKTETKEDKLKNKQAREQQRKDKREARRENREMANERSRLEKEIGGLQSNISSLQLSMKNSEENEQKEEITRQINDLLKQIQEKQKRINEINQTLS